MLCSNCPQSFQLLVPNPPSFPIGLLIRFGEIADEVSTSAGFDYISSSLQFVNAPFVRCNLFRGMHNLFEMSTEILWEDRSLEMFPALWVNLIGLHADVTWFIKPDWFVYNTSLYWIEYAFWLLSISTLYISILCEIL